MNGRDSLVCLQATLICTWMKELVLILYICCISVAYYLSSTYLLAHSGFLWGSLELHRTSPFSEPSTAGSMSLIIPHLRSKGRAMVCGDQKIMFHSKQCLPSLVLTLSLVFCFCKRTQSYFYEVEKGVQWKVF